MFNAPPSTPHGPTPHSNSIVELNVSSTGVIQTKTSTTAMPAADAGNIVLFSDHSLDCTIRNRPAKQPRFPLAWNRVPELIHAGVQNMADEPISSLTLYTTYHTADEVEILDTVDQTFAPTGTNKRIPFSTLLSMAGVGTVAEGGTGLTSVGSNDQLLGVTHPGGGLEYKTLAAGANVTITPTAGTITIASSGGSGGYATVDNAGAPLTQRTTINFTGAGVTAVDNSGASRTDVTIPATVSSVGLTTPAWLSVANSPVTSAGTLAVTATTGQTQNQFLATPNGSAGAVALRAIANADMPAPGSSGQLIYNSSNLFGGAASLTIGSSGQLNYAGITDPGSPKAGDLWYSSGQNTLASFDGHEYQTSAGSSGKPSHRDGVANSSSQTSLLTGSRHNGEA